MGGMEFLIGVLLLGVIVFTARLSRRIGAIEKTLDETVAQHKAEIEALIAERIEQKVEQIKEAQQNEIALMTQKIGEIEIAGVERIEAYTAQVDAQLKALKDGIALKPDLHTLNGRFDAIEQRITELNETAAEVRREVRGQIEEAVGDDAKLQNQIKAAIGDDLTNAFRKLDDTLTSVLGEMRNEMLRGVKRIDEIQCVRPTEEKADA